MPIIYALVAQDSVVLAEHALKTGNFPVIAQYILEKIEAGDMKMTYVYDRYLFHFISQGNLVYLCLADDTFGRRIPFAYLEDIMDKFEKNYGPMKSDPIAFGMNEFSRILSSRMEFFNEHPDSDSFRKVQGDLDQVKDIMIQNIEKVMERGERIELLVDKTDALTQSSFAFRKRATTVKRTMWWRNYKVNFSLVVVMLLLIYFSVGSFCGLPAFSECIPH